MNKLTAADYADTGQWKLLVNIRRNGMDAYIKNLLYAELPSQKLFSTTWPSDTEDVLVNIENAVYDHPQVLEDYTAQITVYDPRTLFMPAAVNDDNPGIDEDFYSTLFTCDATDLMTDEDEGVMALFYGTKGLKSFLMRTFPGAKITNRLLDIVRKEKRGEDLHFKVEVRENDADFVLMNGHRLISASTHKWFTPVEIAYYIFNILDVYDIDPAGVAVTFGGNEIDRKTIDFLTSNLKSLRVEG